MARTPAWRLDPSSYPHHATVQTRFQDLDVLGHINNVACAALFETARVHFNHALGLQKWKGHRWLVAHVGIDYLAEGHFPTEVVIGNGIGEIGTRSWRILSTAFQHDEPIATCDAVLVMERQTDMTELPDGFRAALEKYRIASAGSAA